MAHGRVVGPGNDLPRVAGIIGNPAAVPTIDDFVKQRTSRAVQAQAYMSKRAAEGTVPITGSFRAEIGTWIEQGGVPPWETPEPTEGQQPYPPTGTPSAG